MLPVAERGKRFSTVSHWQAVKYSSSQINALYYMRSQIIARNQSYGQYDQSCHVEGEELEV